MKEHTSKNPIQHIRRVKDMNHGRIVKQLQTKLPLSEKNAEMKSIITAPA
jgi:hypothetical protein